MFMEKGHRYLQIMAVAMSLLVPCLLLAGYTLHLGYIGTFGLESEVISKGLADVITESWVLGVMVVNYGLPKWPYFLIPLFILWLLSVGVMYLATYLQNSGKLNRHHEEITQENQGKVYRGLTHWKWKCIFEAFEDMAPWFTTPIAVLAVSAIVIILPYGVGKEDALKQLVNYRTHGCEAGVKCTKLVDISGEEERLVVQGILVSANGSRIAIYSDGNIKVYPLLDKHILVKGLSELIVSELDSRLSRNDEEKLASHPD